MKWFKGFTLAEVLITLTIIGVVAALTLPSLVSNTQRARVGPSLAKVMNTLDNANRLMISSHEVTDLSVICGLDYTSCVGEFVKGYKMQQTEFAELVNTGSEGYDSYRMYDNSLYRTLGNPIGAYIFNDGTTVIQSQNKIEGPVANCPRNKFSCRYYPIYVDINGANKKPNVLGVDLFFFVVDLKGSVIPYGGRLFAVWNPNPGPDPIWSMNNSSWQCDERKVVADARPCTGSIADNGWKMIYH